jgi:hypothetical protein
MFVTVVIGTYFFIHQVGLCGGGSSASAECEWTWTPTNHWTDPLVDSCDDECWYWGEVCESYYVHSTNAAIQDSWGYAFDNEYLCSGVAQAVQEQSSNWEVMFVYHPCQPSAYGKVKGEFEPKHYLCANAEDPPKWAFIASVMQAQSSVADSQDGDTPIWDPALQAEASAGDNDGGSEPFFSIMIMGTGVTVSFGSPGSSDVGEIAPPKKTKWYNVTQETNYEIEFSYQASVKVDCLAAWSGEVWAKCGRSKFGNKFTLYYVCSRCGGKEPIEYDVESGVSAQIPNCSESPD